MQSNTFLQYVIEAHQRADANSFTDKDDFEWYLEHDPNPVQLLERCTKYIENQSYFDQHFKNTHLHKAIINNEPDLACYFLSKGADIDSRINGKSLIEKAIDKKNGPMFIEVLANGATIPHSVNVDFVSVHGFRPVNVSLHGTRLVHHTPLFYLVSTLLDNCMKTPRSNVDEKQISRLRQLIEKLIDAGADINYKNGDGKTPHDLAQAHPEAASLLQAGFGAGEAQVSTRCGYSL